MPVQRSLTARGVRRHLTREKLFNEAVEMASVEDTAKFEGHDVSFAALGVHLQLLAASQVERLVPSPQFIKMKEPPANAVLEKGKSYQIEWICRDPEVQDVVIKLFSRDHMVTTISESHINNGFMLWTVPHWLVRHPPASSHPAVHGGRVAVCRRTG